MTAFNTEVYYSERTPLGLIPAHWAVVHRCRTCGQNVPTDDLIDHARQHPEPIDP